MRQVVTTKKVGVTRRIALVISHGEDFSSSRGNRIYSMDPRPTPS